MENEPAMSQHTEQVMARVALRRADKQVQKAEDEHRVLCTEQWKELAKLKLAHWHKLDEKKLKKYRLKKINLLNENKFFINLHKIGYTKVRSKSPIDKKNLLVKAFQRRFRQGLVNGISDQECFILSKNLLKS